MATHIVLIRNLKNLKLKKQISIIPKKKNESKQKKAKFIIIYTRFQEVKYIKKNKTMIKINVCTHLFNTDAQKT